MRQSLRLLPRLRRRRAVDHAMSEFRRPSPMDASRAWLGTNQPKASLGSLLRRATEQGSARAADGSGGGQHGTVRRSAAARDGDRRTERRGKPNEEARESWALALRRGGVRRLGLSGRSFGRVLGFSMQN